VKIAIIVMLVLLALLVGGALLAGPGLTEGFSALKPKPGGTPVRMESVTTGTLVETVQAPGLIEPHTHIDIAAEVSARIVQLPVEEGQEVTKGQLICKLDDKDVKALLISARARRDGERFRLQADRARLDGLRSRLSFARRELDRMQALHDTGDPGTSMRPPTRCRTWRRRWRPPPTRSPWSRARWNRPRPTSSGPRTRWPTRSSPRRWTAW
jgi:multidrug efflux pump subunit AcrA (membrane-fusion protein)